VSGIVFLKTNVAESLLSLHVQSPLDSCTYLGLDCGNQPIQVSLFFDLLIAMATNLTREAFISGKCGKTYNNKFGIEASCSNENMLARSLVWKELNSYKMSARIIADSQHLYWSNEQNAGYHACNLLKIAPVKEVHSVSQVHNSSSSNSWLLVNSCLETHVLQLSSNTVIFDSLLRTRSLKIGENCFISGIRFCDDQCGSSGKTFDECKAFTCNLSLKVALIYFLNESEASNSDLTKACAENWSESIMSTLDDVLLADVNSVIKTRTLSCIADILSIKAGVTGGLRTGPGSNRTWNKAFTFLLNGNIEEGLKELLKERSHWLNRPDHLMRAARHYERAAQIFIQNSVKTVKEYMRLTPVLLPEIGAQVTAECPARIDIQGGWSDTPPICYELGGSVVNIALLIDGKKPIGSRAFRTREPYITLKIGLREITQVIVIKDMKDVLNYDQPNAQGALLKAALICANIVDVNCEKSLEEQLLGNFGGGFEIQSWSLLPQGCGMGTSSILAGAIVAVLWTVTGKSFDKSSVIHAVLYVEQLLTTGGGWQDQVAGITGGVNRGYSEPTFPLHVQVEPLQIQTSILEKLNAHFLLIYTGKVRLAKNLLQNVIRNWYAREETIVRCFKDLITHSFEMKAALLNGDFPEIGRLMDIYWEQKKILAPGCEPASVKEIMDIIKPLCYGQLLVGAGGGGFMSVLTKEPNAKEVIKAALQKYKEHQKLSIHDVTIHQEGLEITL
ncbi:L-fucose kinase, partial [Araneus ventricosus]